MGKTIERIALERGHEIVSVIDVDNLDDFESDAFKSADVAIEFTVPQVALRNYRRAFASGVAVVSGTTGWTEELPALKKRNRKRRKYVVLVVKFQHRCKYLYGCK